jgi:hypothetical protein
MPLYSSGSLGGHSSGDALKNKIVTSVVIWPQIPEALVSCFHGWVSQYGDLFWNLLIFHLLNSWVIYSNLCISALRHFCEARLVSIFLVESMDVCNGYLRGSNFKNKTAISVVPDFVLPSMTFCGASAPIKVRTVLLFISFEVHTINWVITFSLRVKICWPDHFLMLFLEDFLDNSRDDSDPDGSFYVPGRVHFLSVRDFKPGILTKLALDSVAFGCIKGGPMYYFR